MYQNIDKTEKIYLYDVYQGAYVKMFPTKLDALKFLASNKEKIDWCKGDRNTYLDHINMGNDKENLTVPKTYRDNDGQMRFYYDIQMVDRQYIFVDGLDRIVDFRLYRKEINYLYEKGQFDYESYPKRKKRWSKYSLANRYSKFREEPVPFTGKRSGTQAYRIPKLHNLYKQIADKEYQEFVRPKRNLNNLPNVYWDDAPVRSRFDSRSWKDCTKKRKQWM